MADTLIRPTRRIARGEARQLGRLAWFVFVDGRLAWQTNVPRR